MDDISKRDNNLSVSEKSPIVRFLMMLGAERKKIILIPLAFALIGYMASHLLPNIYTATAVILVPQQNQDALTGAFFRGGVFFDSLPGTSRATEETYYGIMQSEAYLRILVDKLDLKKRYGEELYVNAIDVLRRNLTEKIEKKSGFFYINADDKDPKFAANLANGAIEILREEIARMTAADVKRRYDFYEKQVAQVRQQLAEAELKNRLSQERGGIMSLDAQTNTAVSALADLRAQITSREIQLQAMKSYATSRHPDVIRLNGELNALRKQLEKTEQGEDQATATLPKKDTQAMANLRNFREVKYLESVLDSLIRQLEATRIEGLFQVNSFQIVQPALPPELKSKPGRMMIGLLLGILTFAILVVRIYMRRHPSPDMKDILASWGIQQRKAAGL